MPSKEYFRKKNRENYEFKKKVSKEYRLLGSNVTETFSEMLKRKRNKK